MKSAQPFLGITAPVLKRVTNEVMRAHPLDSQARFLDVIIDMWRRAQHREVRYSAIQIAGAPRHRKWLDATAIPVLDEMVVTGAWWDHVDALATNHFGTVLRTEGESMKTQLRAWAVDDDMWRRRVAILVQLKFKADTDEQLLFDAIEPSIASKEFFLRKAIGWALREYAKTAPQVVIDYVTRRADALSGLSKREALRILLKNGDIAALP